MRLAVDVDCTYTIYNIYQTGTAPVIPLTPWACISQLRMQCMWSRAGGRSQDPASVWPVSLDEGEWIKS